MGLYTNEIFRMLLLTVISFALAMACIPFMTNILYKYQFWKKPKEEWTRTRQSFDDYRIVD